MIAKILKDMKDLFKVQDKAKFMKQNIPYLAFFYVGNIFSHHVRSYTGGDVIDKIFQGILELNTMSFVEDVKRAIIDFCNREYEENHSYDEFDTLYPDLKHIGIAYTNRIYTIRYTE